MLRSGWTLQATAQTLGYHRNSLSRRLRETGFRVRVQGRPVPTRRTQVPESLILDEFRSGTSILALSKSYKVSRTVIRRVLRDLGAATVRIRNRAAQARPAVRPEQPCSTES
ncbi:hypothetical protein JNW90_13325 [Micromonospora sp. STR1s_5]|nr:hypothetical protein [Micromonospora sp. STR1s_5]